MFLYFLGSTARRVRIVSRGNIARVEVSPTIASRSHNCTDRPLFVKTASLTAMPPRMAVRSAALKLSERSPIILYDCQSKLCRHTIEK